MGKFYVFMVVLFGIVLLSYMFVPRATIPQEPLDIEVLFCPRDQCLESMISLINASDEIYCAFYDLDLEPLIALLEEKEAHVVIENENALPQFASGYSPALMHNKFCVLDNWRVITGSINPTERGNYYNNNNLVIIESSFVAENYMEEFEEIVSEEFGGGRKVSFPVVRDNTTVVETYFCPEDNCKWHIINALGSANASIYFMTFSFTDEDIGNLLWNKQYQGLDVRGIMESRQISQWSRYEDIRHFTKKDENPYTMHHKVFIIDNSTVITGSYNPTRNANERNDENLLIIHDEIIARQFLDEFDYIYGTYPDVNSSLVLSRVLYDALGRDAGNEFVEIRNTGESSIRLDYYFLSDNNTNFRLEGVLGPNQTHRASPSFSLRNTKGTLLLKKHLHIVDYVHWQGQWDIRAEEGEVLLRIDDPPEPSSWTAIQLNTDVSLSS